MMFRSPVYALTWLVFKKQQWGIIALIALIPFLMIVEFMLSQYFAIEDIQNNEKFHAMILGVVMPLILFIFTMADASTSHFHQGFPRFTFIHPVSSAKLALVPVVSGIVFTTFFLIAWLVLIAGKSILFYQYGLLILAVSGSMSWLQMVSWRLSDSPYLTILILLALIAVVFVLVVSTWNTESMVPLIPTWLAFIGLFALSLSGIWLAVGSIKIARINKTTAKHRYLSNIGFIGFNLPKHYHSISHALFRNEWRVFGWILPMSGVFLVAVLAFIPFIIRSTFQIIPVILLFLMPLVLLPWTLPAEMAKSDLTRNSGKQTGLSSFLLSLPISNFSIAMAKLKLASMSILLFHAMTLITANIVLFSLSSESCETGTIGETKMCLTSPWDWLSHQFGVLNSLLIIISANLILPLIAWTLGGNTLSWCLKGNKFFTIKRTIISVITGLIVILFGMKIHSSEALRVIVWSYAPYINGLIFISVVLYFTRAVKRYLQTGSLQLLKSVIVIAIPLLMLFLFTVYRLEFVSGSNPHPALFLLELFLLAILPILTSPVSIAKNRAR